MQPQKHQWITLTEFQAFWTQRPELKFLEAARVFQIEKNMTALVQEMKTHDIQSEFDKVWTLADRRERRTQTAGQRGTK